MSDNNSFLSDLSEDSDSKEIQVDDLLNTKINYKTKIMDIETIFLNLRRGDYVIPKYQRQFVWDKIQTINLVMSLIKNIPIPPIYLYYDKNGRYVILDGQQRITALFLYYKNLFYIGKEERKKIDFKDVSEKVDMLEELDQAIGKYKLNNKEFSKEIKKNEEEKRRIYTELKDQYNLNKATFVIESNKENENTNLNEKNLTFGELDEKAKRVLIRRDIEVVYVQCDADNSQAVYSDIFKLLNSAGKELSSQEIRNGIYSENYLYDKVYSFNKDSIIWRKIYGNSSQVAKDMEFLLRALALNFYTEVKDEKIFCINEKTFSYANIIDNYSGRFNYFNSQENHADIEIEKLKRFFDKIIMPNNLSTNKCTKTVLEAIFISFCKLELLDKEDIINFEWLVALTKESALGKETASNKSSVEDRLSKAYKLVREKYANECK